MSVQAITSALAMTGISSNEKYLLIVLANYADAEFRCWPSIKRLCDDTGMSERTVQRCFKALVEAGIIRRSERKRQDGSRTSDLLTLVFEGGVKLAPRGAKRDTGGRQSDAKAPSDWHPGGVTVAPLTTFEPTIEPSIEPSLNRAREFGEEFALFWSEYPMQIDEDDARKAYALARKRASFETILRGLAHAKATSPRWRDGKIPDPKNWLEKDKWNDKFRAVSAAAQKQSARQENLRRAYNASADLIARGDGDIGGGGYDGL